MHVTLDRVQRRHVYSVRHRRGVNKRRGCNILVCHNLLSILNIAMYRSQAIRVARASRPAVRPLVRILGADIVSH